MDTGSDGSVAVQEPHFVTSAVVESDLAERAKVGGSDALNTDMGGAWG